MTLRFYKLLLLWLLMAALPLQGMAAAIGASCGPSGYADIASSAVMHHEAGMSMQHHDEQTSDMQMTDGHDMADAGNAPVNSHPSKHKNSSCSACAACCVGALAPPSISISVPHFDTAEVTQISSIPLVPGFVPGGLERPPKRFLA